MPEHLAFLAVAILVVAFLYSCVGHAGASGYIAVMTLCGLPVAVIRPTALALNVLVATIAALSVALVTPFMHPIREVTSVLSVNYAYIDTYFHTNLVQALMRHTPLAEWPNVAGMPPIFYQDLHHV